MKPERAFVAARPVASHSPALLRPKPGAAELIPALARAGERLAKAMRGALAPMLGGTEPAITCTRPAQTDYADFASEIPGLAANSLYAAGLQGALLMTSIEGEYVLRLVDRAFGGPGDTPGSLPREFPLSADLMIGRIENLIAARLAETLGSAAIRPLRRDANLGQLQPFADTTPLAALSLNVLEAGRMPWSIALAFPLDTLADLFGHGERPSTPRPPRGPALPTDAPYADMPLPVSAVLVDMALPLSAISRLEIGQVLSVPIARQVPLRVAGRTVAAGSIGAVDDRVAIQITQLS